MRVRTGAAVAATAAGLVLSGCGGEQEQPSTLPALTGVPASSPASSPTGAPSHPQTSSPTPRVSVPVTGVEAEISAFMQEFFRLSAAMYESEDAFAQRRTMYSDTCTSCVAGADLAREALDKSYVHESGEATATLLGVDEFENNQARYRVLVDVPAGRLKDKDGRVVREFAPTSDVTVLYTARRQQSGQWIIISDTVLP